MRRNGAADASCDQGSLCYAHKRTGHLLNASELNEFEEYVQQLRDLETLLKTIEVPEQFEGLHANLRRALAKGRSSLVLLQDLTLQAMKSPVVVPGIASPVAIRALAEHTTRRLVELANA